MFPLRAEQMLATFLEPISIEITHESNPGLLGAMNDTFMRARTEVEVSIELTLSVMLVHAYILTTS